MNKLLILIIICLISFFSYVIAQGDLLRYHFSDGITTLNGTDICVSGGLTCLSAAGGVYDLDMVADIGSGTITNAETLNISGEGIISTYITGNNFIINASASAGGGNSTEEIQDAAWDVTGGTQTRITVTYQDGTDDVDFVVDDMNDDDPEPGDVDWTDLTDDGTFTDTKICTYDLGNTRIDCDTTDSDTQLTQEEVQDFAWDVTGGTQTRITVTYQDGTDDVDFVVDDMNDDVPEAGDFGNAADLDVNGEVIDDSHNHVYSNIDTTTSANWATIVSDETGTGNWVFSNSPVLVTPTLGVASATTLNTGQGANELYDMNQNVLTTSDVTFNNVTLEAVYMELNTTCPAIMENGSCRLFLSINCEVRLALCN